jgi:hypothetical protein
MVVAFFLLVGLWVLILHRLGRVEPREGAHPWITTGGLLEDTDVREQEEVRDAEETGVTLYPEIQPGAVPNRRVDAGILADEMADELDQMVRRDNQRRAKRQRRVTSASKREEERASREKEKEALRRRFDRTRDSEPDSQHRGTRIDRQFTMVGLDNFEDGEYTRFPLPQTGEGSSGSVNDLFPITERTRIRISRDGNPSSPPVMTLETHSTPATCMQRDSK